MNDSAAGMLLVFVAGALAVAVGALTAAAWIVGVGRPPAPVTDAVIGIMLEGRSPTAAWGIGGSDVLYWGTVAALAVGSVAVVALLVRLISRKRWGLKDRERLGSRTEARLATTRDLEALWVKWQPGGRFLLGRTHGWLDTRFGSKLLAAEWKADPNAAKLTERHQGPETRWYCNDLGPLWTVPRLQADSPSPLRLHEIG